MCAAPHAEYKTQNNLIQNVLPNSKGTILQVKNLGISIIEDKLALSLSVWKQNVQDLEWFKLSEMALVYCNQYNVSPIRTHSTVNAGLRLGGKATTTSLRNYQKTKKDLKQT